MKYLLVKRVSKEKHDLYIPQEAFYINVFLDDYIIENTEIDHVALIFDSECKRLMGCVEYEKDKFGKKDWFSYQGINSG